MLIIQELELFLVFVGQNIPININKHANNIDFLFMKIGDKISKKGIKVSGDSVKGIINPHNDKNADKGVKLFSYTAYCRK